MWYRQGVTPSYPQGSGWEHVSNNVRRVSVGPLDQVWGDGAGAGRLRWGRGRGGIWVPALVSPPLTPGSPCSRGLGLQRVCSGSAFQVWVIADKVQGSHGLSRGTVCHRTGVQPLEPKGLGWDYGIGVSRAGIGGLSRLGL